VKTFGKPHLQINRLRKICLRVAKVRLETQAGGEKRLPLGALCALLGGAIFDGAASCLDLGGALGFGRFSAFGFDGLGAFGAGGFGRLDRDGAFGFGLFGASRLNGLYRFRAG
jgi:hypothetical protein